jgi:hypothetical protein
LTVPYLPPPLATPIINPVVGSSGAPPLPYVSNTEFTFAPTGLDANHLYPGGTATKNAQSLADTIRRASRWCDDICFGQDPAGKGASLAASLSVESATVRVKGGTLRLICDFRPIVQVVGIALGSGPANVSSLDPTIASLTTIGRRTIYVPVGTAIAVARPGDSPGTFPSGSSPGSVYAVWSYVNGYPHTRLATNVAQGATSCVVTAVDGAGGLWGVFGASGAFPGTELTVVDAGTTERVFVHSVTANTPTTGKTKLTTSAFANAHTVPVGPDFIPVTAVPQDVHQAVISLATALVKVRGTRAQVMSSQPGGRPSQAALAQAGALEDYAIGLKILTEGGFRIRIKHTGSY